MSGNFNLILPRVASIPLAKDGEAFYLASDYIALSFYHIGGIKISCFQELRRNNLTILPRDLGIRSRTQRNLHIDAYLPDKK
ncbi:hypothetical protein I7I53_11687 [Histoplasma capsulatum var. duboisii H88]|uniref:Uncharacterized protein n=1 Tax=Ajellomyces capsulatus (strain H88) TaxID=544711 RepID=A0A8A1LUM8_AJEC8|nr:hypothetical protein I7I53_11687 [Histoplasma capsulatum var. duboisii H88]